MRVNGPDSIRGVRVLFVLGLLMAVTSAAFAGGPCVGDAPESVLDCLARAYEARDLAAIEALYAPDFEFWFGTDASHTAWGREDEVKSAANLLANEKVRGIRFEIVGVPESVPGIEPNTWIIRGVDSHLEIAADQSAEPYKVEGKDHEFLVRRLTEPTPHWQIYRWTDPNKQ